MIQTWGNGTQAYASPKYVEAAQPTVAYPSQNYHGQMGSTHLYPVSKKKMKVTLPPGMASQADRIMELEAQVKATMEAHLDGVDGLVRSALAMMSNPKGAQQAQVMQQAMQQAQLGQQQQFVTCSRCLMRGSPSLFSTSQLNKRAGSQRRYKRKSGGQEGIVCKQCTAARQLTQREAKMQSALAQLFTTLVPGEDGVKELKSYEMKKPATQTQMKRATTAVAKVQPTYRLAKLTGRVQGLVRKLMADKKSAPQAAASDKKSAPQAAASDIPQLATPAADEVSQP